MYRWVVVLSVASVTGLTILSPPELAANINSPLFNILIGSREPFSVTGEAIALDIVETLDQCRRNEFQQNVLNKVAVIEHRGPSMESEDEVAQCLEERGAIAVVRLTLGNVAEAGMTYTWTEPGVGGLSHLPFVQALLSSMQPALDAMKQGTPVLIQVQADKNHWQVMYNSLTFVLLMRIFLPAINLVGVYIAAQASVTHLARILSLSEFRNKTRTSVVAEFDTTVIKHNAWLMLFGSLLILESCLIRLVYFAFGPIFANPDLYYATHMMLMVTTIGTDMLTTAISVSLFLRWGAFGKVDSWLKRNLDRILVVVGLLDMIAAHMLGFAQTRASNMVELLLVCSVIITLSLVVVSVAFLSAGIRFIKVLRAAPESSEDHARMKRVHKAIAWITISGACLVVQIIGAVFSIITSLLYSPQGFMFIFFVHFLGLTCAGVSQAFAFRPLDSTQISIAKRVKNAFWNECC